MPKPTITYGHGCLDDCDHDDPATYYTETPFNMLAGDATPTTLHGDILQIEATFDEGATEEYVIYSKDISSLNLSSDTYTKYLIRWKTSEAANGAKAALGIEFSAGPAQGIDLYPNNDTSKPKGYSTTWTTSSGTINAGKTIDKYWLYADDDGTDGTFKVYYDFLMLHEGTFTFPHVATAGGGGGVPIRFPKRLVQLGIPGRDMDVLQDLGLASTEIVLEGDVLSGESWGTPTFQYLLRILRERDAFQWFTSDWINCKVKVKDFDIIPSSRNKLPLNWRLTLRQYSLSSLAKTTWSNLQWIGYES